MGAIALGRSPSILLRADLHGVEDANGRAAWTIAVTQGGRTATAGVSPFQAEP